MRSSNSERVAEPVLTKPSLTELFHALESPLLGFAYQMVKNESLAQDIVQEAFMRLHKRWDSVEQAKAWLYTTVRRLAIDHLRRSHRVVPFARDENECEVEPVDGQLTPDQWVDVHERKGLMRVCMERLAPREAALLRLKFIENLSYKEIAVHLQMTVSHVGYSLHHALKSLELELNKEGMEA